MGLVIGLIAILMVLFSGLSAGLVNDGVCGLKAQPVHASPCSAWTPKASSPPRLPRATR